MTKKASKSINAIVAPKSNHRRAKAPARKPQPTPAGKHTEKRAQPQWALRFEEESLYIADYGNAV